MKVRQTWQRIKIGWSQICDVLGGLEKRTVYCARKELTHARRTCTNHTSTIRAARTTPFVGFSQWMQSEISGLVSLLQQCLLSQLLCNVQLHKDVSTQLNLGLRKVTWLALSGILWSALSSSGYNLGLGLDGYHLYMKEQSSNLDQRTAYHPL